MNFDNSIEALNNIFYVLDSIDQKLTKNHGNDSNIDDKRQAELTIDLAGSGSKVLQTVLTAQSGKNLKDIAKGIRYLTGAIKELDTTSFEKDNGSFIELMTALSSISTIDTSKIGAFNKDKANDFNEFIKNISAGINDINDIKFDPEFSSKVKTINDILNVFSDKSLNIKFKNPVSTWLWGKRFSSFIKMFRKSVLDNLNGIKITADFNGLSKLLNIFNNSVNSRNFLIASKVFTEKRSENIVKALKTLINGIDSKTFSSSNISDSIKNLRGITNVIDSIVNVFKKMAVLALIMTGVTIIGGPAGFVSLMINVGVVFGMTFAILRMTEFEMKRMKDIKASFHDFASLIKDLMFSVTLMVGISVALSLLPFTTLIKTYINMGILFAGFGVMLISAKYISKFAEGGREGLREIGVTMLLLSGTLILMSVAAIIVKNHEGDFLLMIAGMGAFILGFYFFAQITNKAAPSIMTAVMSFTIFIAALTGGLYLTLGAVALATVIMKMNEVGYGIAAVLGIISGEILIYVLLMKTFNSKTFIAQGAPAIANFAIFLTVILATTTLILTLSLLAENIITQHRQGFVAVTAIMGSMIILYTLLNVFSPGGNLHRIKDLYVSDTLFNYIMFIGGLLLSTEIVLLLSRQAENIKMDSLLKVVSIMIFFSALYTGFTFWDTILPTEELSWGNAISKVPRNLYNFGMFAIGLLSAVFIVEKLAVEADNVNWESLLKIGVIITALSGIFMAVDSLSRKISDESLVRIGKIELMMGGISVIIGIASLAAIAAGKIKWSSFLKIPPLLAIIGAVTAGLFFAEKYITPVELSRIGLLIGVLGGISAVIGVASLAAIAAGKIQWSSFIKIPALLGELGLIVAGLAVVSLLLTGPQAAIIIPGVFLLEGLMGGLAVVIGAAALAALAYGNAEKKVTDLPGVGSRIGKMLGGFVSGISDIITLSLVAKLPAIAAFGVALLPILLSLSKFIDVIGKFGDLKRPVSFDAKGNPTSYVSFSPDDFLKAADVITSAFDNFIGRLYTQAKHFNIFSTIIIGLLGVSLFPLMHAVSSFVNSIMKLAGGTYKITDANGNEVIRKISTADMISAADIIVTWFTTFLNRMVENTKQIGILKTVVIGSFGVALLPIFMAVSSFINSIMNLAAGTYKITDANGNEVIRKISMSDMEIAAKDTVQFFSIFLNTLIQSVKKLGILKQFAISSLSHSILPIMKSVGMFSDIILKTSAGIVKYTGDDGKIHIIRVNMNEMANAAKSIADNFSVFIHSLISNLSSLNPLKQLALSSLSDNISPIMKSVSEFVDIISIFSVDNNGNPSIAVISGYDKSGKPIFATENGKIKRINLGNIGYIIGTQFSRFIKNIVTRLSENDLKDKSSDTVSLLQDSITPMFSEIQKYISVFSSFANGNLYMKIPGIMHSVVSALSDVFPILNGDGTTSPHRIPRFGSALATENIKNYMDSISEISNGFDLINKFSSNSVDYTNVMRNARNYINFLYILSDQNLPKLSKTAGEAINYLCGKISKFDIVINKSTSLIVSSAQKFKNSTVTIGKSIDDVYNNHRKQIDYFAEKTDNIAKNLTIVNEDLKSISANSQAKQDLYYLADAFHEMTMQEINMLNTAVNQLNSNLNTNLGFNVSPIQNPIGGGNNMTVAAAAPAQVTLSGPFVFRTDKGGILLKGELDSNS